MPLSLLVSRRDLLHEPYVALFIALCALRKLQFVDGNMKYQLFIYLLTVEDMFTISTRRQFIFNVSGRIRNVGLLRYVSPSAHNLQI